MTEKKDTEALEDDGLGTQPTREAPENSEAVRALDDEAVEGAPNTGDAGPENTVVAELRDELQSLNERHLRLAAEFDNYRKRNLRERELLASRLQANLVTALLDVLDDLQRVEEGTDASAEAVLEGVRLVEKKLVNVLKGAGLEPVDADDSPFDPEFMEAFGMVPTDDPEQDGHVADVFQRGYRLGEVLLRPARVRVYQHEPSD